MGKIEFLSLFFYGGDVTEAYFVRYNALAECVFGLLYGNNIPNNPGRPNLLILF
jgi:hypothetical protein